MSKLASCDKSSVRQTPCEEACMCQKGQSYKNLKRHVLIFITLNGVCVVFCSCCFVCVVGCFVLIGFCVWLLCGGWGLCACLGVGGGNVKLAGF